MIRQSLCTTLITFLVLCYNSNLPAQGGGDAPDFTQKDCDGKEVKLSALKGKPILIFFYAHDCTECRTVLKTVLESLKQYNDKKDKKKEIVSIGFLYRATDSFNQDQRKKHKDDFGIAFTHYFTFPPDFGPIYKSYNHIATKKQKDPYVLAIVNSEGKIALCVRGTTDGLDDALKQVTK